MNVKLQKVFLRRHCYCHVKLISINIDCQAPHEPFSLMAN